MGDTHRLIIGEVQAEPVSDLLRAPRLRPPPVLTAAMSPAGPPDLRTGDAGPVRPLHGAGLAVLHIPAQLRVDGELRRLRTPSATVSMPLRGRRPILEISATRRGVPAQLTGDRRRRPTELTRDLPHPTATGAQDRNLLPFGERQVAPRQRGEGDRRHPATLPKPPDTNRRRHPCLHRVILAGQPARDRDPEPHAMLPPPSRRPSPRTHTRSTGTLPSLNPSTHRNLFSIERCEDHLNPPREPWSEWCTNATSAPGPRIPSAILSASSTSVVRMFCASCQPTTMRLKASTMKAKNKIPSQQRR